MKEFFKYTLATVTGIVLVTVLMGLMGIISVVGMLASAESAVQVKDNSVLVLPLSGELTEQSNDDAFSALSGQLTGNAASGLGLSDILAAIDNAKNSDKVKGIYIEAGAFVCDAPASATAIRNKLADFRKSGKWIVAYGETFTQTTYYICSVADKVYINPQGMLDWHGLSAQPMFLKDMLAKVGVRVQLTKVGKYKSAPEMLTADGMSDPNREQVTAYLEGIWQKMLADVSASRKVPVPALNAAADSLMALADPQDYVRLKLVDGLLYTDQVKDEVKKMLKADADDAVNQVSLADMGSVESEKRGDKIAVYYAWGDIVTSPGTGPGSSACIASETVCRDLEELADDDDVKAVVLRVNSGGGSAYASEQIWRSVTRLKAKKPVVVSMGGYAASGGYYISCAANYIYAEPTTLTGSIGIFGMFPDASGLLTDKLGIKFDEVKTNRHAAFGTMSRPFNADEMRLLNAYIGRGYSLFRKRVADGRRMKIDDVEAVAQGRVWLGKDALKIKLVDGMGGLDEAVKKAAELAKASEYHTAEYPTPPTWLEQLLGGMSHDNYLDESMKALTGEYYNTFMTLKRIEGLDAVQARMPYNITIK